MSVPKLPYIAMVVYSKKCLTTAIGIILWAVIFKGIDKNFAAGT